MNARRNRKINVGRWLGLTVGLVLTVAALPASIVQPRPAVREIALEARDMAFYLAGQSEANPTIRVKAGEPLRIVFRNAQPGMIHDLVVDAFAVRTGALKHQAVASVLVAVPDRPGRYEYVCSFHAVLMRGVVEIY